MIRFGKRLLSPAERFRGGDTVLVLSVRQKPFRPSFTLFCPDAYLDNGFSDFISPCQRFRGEYCFVCPSFLFTSVRPAIEWGGTLWSHLPPTKWESCQLLIMALNPIQTTINRLQTTDSKNLWILYLFIRVVISAGDMNFR